MYRKIGPHGLGSRRKVRGSRRDVRSSNPYRIDARWHDCRGTSRSDAAPCVKNSRRQGYSDLSGRTGARFLRHIEKKCCHVHANY
ncbi:hypothetical protein EFR84_07495 [Rhizobium chutanense]|uniref:Uncharacterized protein n=1 Tax=Rhizobium chutanense TaxID=2035448 RepID=A0A3S0SJ95_9HYPH|nr:hypothetical protein EFR84_07495 [Rhizobium chutanense]